MNTYLLASLEKAIGDCLEKVAEEGEHWPDSGYQAPDLHLKMAQAAALVFDANYAGQEYAERENAGGQG